MIWKSLGSKGNFAKIWGWFVILGSESVHFGSCGVECILGLG